jgi:nucleotide-binding universal stress UspA family protein
MNLGNVLFPTDFSAASEPAGLVASEMARQQGARLHIVHVVPPVTDPADSAEKLERLAAALGWLRVETALLSGRVAHQIIRYARDKGIGLIVIGSHGRTGVSRALLGSVAESVVRLAPCPVLTVPGATVGSGGPKPAGVEAPVPHGCIVCARETHELVCETCRTRIRGEALEHKLEAERPGRRGSPV